MAISIVKIENYVTGFNLTLVVHNYAFFTTLNFPITISPTKWSEMSLIKPLSNLGVTALYYTYKPIRRRGGVAIVIVSLYVKGDALSTYEMSLQMSAHTSLR
jgi:hypothetical protein